MLSKKPEGNQSGLPKPHRADFLLKVYVSSSNLYHLAPIGEIAPQFKDFILISQFPNDGSIWLPIRLGY